MRKRCFLLALLLMAALLTGCMRADGSASGDAQGEKPQLPEDLRTDADGVPILKVYDVENEAVSQMDIETYVMGVLAGEMKNDWPEEALKAQAILARTFVLKFIETKDSKYEGADISTDVSEAQAYSEADINDRVRAAVEETRGQVMSYEGELVQAWFHAHAGGKTELPACLLSTRRLTRPIWRRRIRRIPIRRRRTSSTGRRLSTPLRSRKPAPTPALPPAFLRRWRSAKRAPPAAQRPCWSMAQPSARRPCACNWARTP